VGLFIRRSHTSARHGDQLIEVLLQASDQGVHQSGLSSLFGVLHRAATRVGAAERIRPTPTSSFRNGVFFGAPDDAQSPEPSHTRQPVFVWFSGAPQPRSVPLIGYRMMDRAQSYQTVCVRVGLRGTTTSLCAPDRAPDDAQSTEPSHTRQPVFVWVSGAPEPRCVPHLGPTCGIEVRRTLAQLVHVLHATAHQTVAVGVAADIGAAVPRGLLVLEQALPLFLAEGTHLPCAVRGGRRHLQAKATGHVLRSVAAEGVQGPRPMVFNLWYASTAYGIA
jgi:hypothetical protein